jgi:hypothetical protein
MIVCVILSMVSVGPTLDQPLFVRVRGGPSFSEPPRNLAKPLWGVRKNRSSFQSRTVPLQIHPMAEEDNSRAAKLTELSLMLSKVAFPEPR